MNQVALEMSNVHLAVKGAGNRVPYVVRALQVKVSARCMKRMIECSLDEAHDSILVAAILFQTHLKSFSDKHEDALQRAA
jgi:hypothetical protein